MSMSSRISAALGYIPVLGWIYVYFAQRKDKLAIFHLKQSIALVVGMLAVLAVWAVVSWVVTWIPYGDVFAVASFALVLSAWIVGALGWLLGIINALLGRANSVLLFGGIARRLPIREQA